MLIENICKRSHEHKYLILTLIEMNAHGHKATSINVKAIKLTYIHTYFG